MIAANELRIGNWIVYNGNICKVTPEEIDGIYSLTYKGEGIPLSADILDRAGFVKDGESEFGGWLIPVHDGEKIRIKDHPVIGWHWPMNGYNTPMVHYLHQLQNLYHALTGEELTINMNQ